MNTETPKTSSEPQTPPQARRWQARFAIEIQFEAQDANEATALADALCDIPTFGGHSILTRSAVWLAPLASNQEERSDG